MTLPCSICAGDPDGPGHFSGMCLSGDGMGAFLRAVLGADLDPEPGPPYTHVHRLPETEEEMAAEPFLPSLTVERQQEVPPAFRRR